MRTSSPALVLSVALVAFCGPEGTRPDGVDPEAEFSGGNSTPGHWRTCRPFDERLFECIQRRSGDGSLFRTGLYIESVISEIVRYGNSNGIRLGGSPGTIYFDGIGYMPIIEVQYADGGVNNIRLQSLACAESLINRDYGRWYELRDRKLTVDRTDYEEDIKEYADNLNINWGPIEEIAGLPVKSFAMDGCAVGYDFIEWRLPD